MPTSPRMQTAITDHTGLCKLTEGDHSKLLSIFFYFFFMADDESFVKSYFRSCIAIGSKLSSCADISGHAPKCTFISLHVTGCIALASLIMYGKQFCDIRFDLLLLNSLQT